MATYPYTGVIAAPGGGFASEEYVDAQVAGGQILHIRNGAVLANYGEGKIDAIGFGNGLTDAIAALQSGDTLRLRGFEAAGTGWDITDANVKIIARDVTLYPSGSYDYLFRVSSADVEVDGLILDGDTLANTGEGDGFRVSSTASRCRLRNVEAHRIRGTAGQNPGGLLISAAEDVVVDGFRCINPGYVGVRFVNTISATVRNVYIEDPINRAMNIEGDGLMQFIRLVNWEGKYVNNVGQAGVFSNCNVQGCLERLEIDNYHMHNADVVEPGYSYDYPGGLQMFKCHGVRRAYFRRMRLWHGQNKQTSQVAPSFRVPGLGEGVNPEELYFEDCEFAGHMKLPENLGVTIKKVRLRNCHLGARFCDGSAPIDEMNCEEFDAEGCTFNSHQRQTVLEQAVEQRANHRVRVVNCRFIANTSLIVFVFNRAASDRRLIGNYEVHSNQLINHGGGGMFMGNGSLTRLPVTTDAAGAMLFDGNVALGGGSVNMPDPGAGPAYFPTLSIPIRDGVKIWNVAFTTDAVSGVNSIRGWVAAPTTPKSCSFNADDTISATNHGFSNGDQVFFRLGSTNTRFLATFSTTDVITSIGHSFINGNVVEVEVGYNGVLPIVNPTSVVKTGVPYWVRDVAGNTFKLAESSGGPAIDITTTGAGNIYIRRRELPSALETGLSYFVRDADVSTFKVALTSAGAAINIVDTGSFGSPTVVRMQWEAF